MLWTNAIFARKEVNFELETCGVKKVIRLSGAEYDSFARDMLRDQDFIKDNVDLMGFEDGAHGCLLVTGEGRHDGILVDSSGFGYARYSAFIPNVEGLLTVGQYPALSALNQKLTAIADYIIDQAGTKLTGEPVIVDLQDLETVFGIDLLRNGALRQTVLDMLGGRPEIKDFELDKNELTVYPVADSMEQSIVGISDPSVTKTDMYAYGYGWEGMIPLGRERALELFDKGRVVFRLYEDDAEGVADSRNDIETFDGMFGVENPDWKEHLQPEPIEVFILNRERHAKGDTAGEWLTLPADITDLRGLLERVGVERPSENAFSVTAVRVRYECMHDYITKYDSLDELNMLASYMKGMEDFELDKLQAILTSGGMVIGDGPAALINLLDADNFDAFNLIAAADAEELGLYWNEEKPEDISFTDYGKQVMVEEKGVFTEWGYLYFRYKELSPEYGGSVPDMYKIVSGALRTMRSKTPEHSRSEEKPSVVSQIRAARQIPRVPSDRDEQKHKKDKGGPEL